MKKDSLWKGYQSLVIVLKENARPSTENSTNSFVSPCFCKNNPFSQESKGLNLISV